MLKKILVFLIAAETVKLLTLTPARGAAWGTWKKSNQAPQTHPSFWKKSFLFYQKNFSSEDGASCPFYPTCSAYAYEALTKHHVVYGSLLTIDRLLSEYPGMPNAGLYPLITKYGIHRPYDPVP